MSLSPFAPPAPFARPAKSFGAPLMAMEQLDIATISYGLISACLNSVLWPQVLETVCQMTASRAAYVAPANTLPLTAGELGFPFSRGADVLHLHAMLQGTVTNLRQIELEAPELDAVRDPGLPSPRRSNARRSGKLCLHLIRNREAAPFSPEQEAILHHIRLGLSVSLQLLGELDIRLVAATDAALSLAALPTVLFDGAGKVMHVSKQAEPLIGSNLRLIHGELVSRSAMETKQLKLRLRAMLADGNGATDTAGVGPGSAPVRSRGGRRKMAEDATVEVPLSFSRIGRRPLLMSLKWLDTPRPNMAGGPVIAGLLIDLEEHATPTEDCLRGIFHLTHQEFHIACELANGYGAREISENRHLNYETVRSHVKSIMRKMGVTRQAEITALLATLAKV